MKLPPTLAALLFATASLHAQAPGNFLDRLEAERLEQSGTVITILFDDSGSMAGAKIAQAKTAFRDWIGKVPENHRLGLIALNAGRLVPLGRNNRPELLAAVQRLNANGGTPLAKTIRSALAEVERRRGEVGPYERHILLIFTDGEDSTNEGTTGVQRALESTRAKGVETVGIGYQGHGDYLRAAATRYYHAGDVAELRQSLAKVDAEIGDTADVVIDERTRTAMQALAPLPKPTAAAAPKPTAAVALPPTGTPPQSRTIPWVLIVMIFFIIWSVRRAMQGRTR